MTIYRRCVKAAESRLVHESQSMFMNAEWSLSLRLQGADVWQGAGCPTCLLPQAAARGPLAAFRRRRRVIMFLCVLRACLPALPGTRRNAHLGVKLPPASGVQFWLLRRRRGVSLGAVQ